jgi:hypothetical protein
MSEARHTPGPWSVDAVPGLPVYVNAGDDGLRPIAEINALEDGIDNDARHEERLANAVLIAAAPNLLEACKGLRATIERLLPERDLMSQITQKALIAADAAIAKAQPHA